MVWKVSCGGLLVLGAMSIVPAVAQDAGPAEAPPPTASAPPDPAQPGATETSAQPALPTIPVQEPSKPKEAPTPSTEPSGASLEKIVVTANKQSQLLSVVPGTVSVMTGDKLKRIGATSFQDFATYMPGVSSSSNGVGENQIVIRGVASGGSQQSVSSTVGVYVDELPIGSSSAFAFGVFGLDFNAFDLDRVEVLSGPQGTLYGASSLGGLLKYVTAPPALHVWAGTFQAEGTHPQTGDFNYSGRAMLNAPLQLGDVALALRATGFDEKNAGFIDNPSRGLEDVDASLARGGRASLLAQLTSDLSARLGVTQQKITRDGETAVDYDPHTHEPVHGDYDQSPKFDEPFSSRFLQYSGTLKWNNDWADLTSASSWQTSDLASATDQTAAIGGSLGTGSLIPWEVFFGSKLDKFTQEIRLASRSSWFDWQFGGFYTWEHAHAVAKSTGKGINPNPTLPIPGVGPLPIPIPGSILSGLPLPELDLPLVVADLFTKYREGAGFGDVTVHFTDRLDLTLGARYAVNLQEFRQQTGGILGSIPSDTSTKHSRDGVATYLINPRYRFKGSSIVYARVASGYRPGGPNFIAPPPMPAAAPIFTPDRVWNYELGTKIDLGRASLDFDVYYIDWSDIQLLVNQNSLNTITNGGKAKVIGGELSSIYLVMPGLTVGGNLSYSKATLAENSPQLQAKSGAPLPLSPRFSAAATADYRIPLSDTCAGIAGISYRFVGKRASGFDGSTVHPQYWLDGYSMLDLRTGVQWQHFDVALFLKNVLNTSGGISADASALQYDANAPVRVSVTPPRTVGLTLTYRLY